MEVEMKTLGNDSKSLSDVTRLYISKGFFNIDPDSGVVDPAFTINIRYILAILLSKVDNDISKINENSIIINIEKERLSRNLSLYDVLKFMEKKILTKNQSKNGMYLEIFDRYDSKEIPIHDVENITIVGSIEIPSYLDTNINILFNEILEQNSDFKISHYFGYEPTGRYRLKMSGLERWYRTYGGKRKQRKSRKRKTKSKYKRQTRMLL